MGSIMDWDRDTWGQMMKQMHPKPFAKCAAGDPNCGHKHKPLALDLPEVQATLREADKAQSKNPNDRCQSCGCTRSRHNPTTGCINSNCMGKACGCPVFFEKKTEAVNRSRTPLCSHCDHPEDWHDGGPCRKTYKVTARDGMTATTDFCRCVRFDISPIECDHANEVPVICQCPSNCYCKENSCRSRG